MLFAVYVLLSAKGDYTMSFVLAEQLQGAGKVVSSMFSSKKIPVYDTWKMHEYLTREGIGIEVADLFVENYTKLLRHGRGSLVNGTAEQLANEFVKLGCSEGEAREAIDLLRGLLEVNVAA